MIQILYPGPDPRFSRRRILDTECGAFFHAAMQDVTARCRCPLDWTLHLGPELLFDANGLGAVVAALRRYRGAASRLAFRLGLEPQAYRDYYSLGPPLGEQSSVALPVSAERSGGRPNTTETIVLSVRCCAAPLDYPAALAPATVAHTPLALLMAYHHDFDILFANQIAVFSDLARRVPRSPMAWMRAIRRRRGGTFRRRLVQAYADIHPRAEIHPTAVVEGSVVQAGAHIGAHCVVRCSYIGRNAQLFDGAKVEYSVVGAGSWLMHDLVLIRSHVEDEVFLIHGPYQFSSFQHRSAAFATIMMDYRPDGGPIRVSTAAGRVTYGGRFLGAVLGEGAKSLGGSLLSPGITVPADTWLACELDDIHRTPRGELPTCTAISPAASAAAGGIRPAFLTAGGNPGGEPPGARAEPVNVNVDVDESGRDADGAHVVRAGAVTPPSGAQFEENR